MGLRSPTYVPAVAQLFEEFYSQCHVRIEAGGPSCNNCRRLQVDASDVEGFLRLCQGMSLGGGGGGGGH